jgi:hypothetical protein
VSLEILQSWLALLVAAVSIGIAFYGVKLQRQNNLMSVRPLPYISCADYEDLLWVKVRNDGVGPLLINNIRFNRDGSPADFDNLVECLPQLPRGMFWSKLSKGYVRTVPIGADLPLIELHVDIAKLAQTSFRDECRKQLQRIEMTVEYTDMHGSKFKPISRRLDFFASRLASSKAASA